MAIYRHDIFIFILETDKNRRLQCDYNNGYKLYMYFLNTSLVAADKNKINFQ